MGLTQVGTDGIKDDAVTIAKQAAGDAPSVYYWSAAAEL